MTTKLRRAKQKIGNWRKEYIACKAQRRKDLKKLTNCRIALETTLFALANIRSYSGSFIQVEREVNGIEPLVRAALDASNTTSQPTKEE